MNEFEWRRRMHGLGGPVQPDHDLWLGIAHRIEADRATPAPQRRRWPLTLAAALLTGAVSLGLVLLRDTATTVTAARTSEDAFTALDRNNAELRHLTRHDPRLAGASIVLDSATSELEQSLKRQPDAVFLVGLLNRTNDKRLKLARMGLASS